MSVKKIILSIIIFLVIWFIINILPVIPVEYTGNFAELELPKSCSLNYLFSCYDSRDDFGINYPIFLMNTNNEWILLMTIVLPVLVTWTIVYFIIKSKKFRKYFSK